MARAKSRVLTAANRFQVWEAVRDEFTKSDMNDRQFAEHLSTKLGLPVAETTIMDARIAFKIPAHRSTLAAKKADKLTLVQRVERLEKLVAELTEKK